MALAVQTERVEVWTKAVVVEVERVVAIQIYFGGRLDSTCLDMVIICGGRE